MNFENTFLRGDLWIKNVNYSLVISVQSFARTKTVYALFYACPELGHCPQLGHLLIFDVLTILKTMTDDCKVQVWMNERDLN